MFLEIIEGMVYILWSFLQIMYECRYGLHLLKCPYGTHCARRPIKDIYPRIVQYCVSFLIRVDVVLDIGANCQQPGNLNELSSRKRQVVIANRAWSN